MNAPVTDERVTAVQDWWQVLFYEYGWKMALKDFEYKDATQAHWPKPVRIATRAVIYPQRTYCCSMTPSQWIEPVEYAPEFADDAFDGWDHVAESAVYEWWDEELRRDGMEGGYYDFSDCCTLEWKDGCERPREGGLFKKVYGPLYIEVPEEAYEMNSDGEWEITHEAQRRIEDAAREWGYTGWYV